MLTLTVSQIDWIMNLWNEDIYAVINKKKTTTTKKEDTPAPQITHTDKSNKTEILNNMYQKSVAIYTSAIIPKY